MVILKKGISQTFKNQKAGNFSRFYLDQFYLTKLAEKSLGELVLGIVTIMSTR